MGAARGEEVLRAVRDAERREQGERESGSYRHPMLQDGVGGCPIPVPSWSLRALRAGEWREADSACEPQPEPLVKRRRLASREGLLRQLAVASGTEEWLDRALPCGMRRARGRVQHFCELGADESGVT